MAMNIDADCSSETGPTG